MLSRGRCGCQVRQIVPELGFSETHVTALVVALAFGVPPVREDGVGALCDQVVEDPFGAVAVRQSLPAPFAADLVTAFLGFALRDRTALPRKSAHPSRHPRAARRPAQRTRGTAKRPSVTGAVRRERRWPLRGLEGIDAISRSTPSCSKTTSPIWRTRRRIPPWQ